MTEPAAGRGAPSPHESGSPEAPGSGRRLLGQILKAHGAAYPLAAQILSTVVEGHLRRPVGAHLDFEKDVLVVTFEGLAALSDRGIGAIGLRPR